VAKKSGDDDGESPKKGGPKKFLVPVVLLVLGAFAGKMVFGGAAPKSPEEAQAAAEAAERALDRTCRLANGMKVAKAAHAGGTDEPADEPADEEMGPVLEMDPITLNLSDGHYLKLGLALQLPAAADVEMFDSEGKGAKGRDLAMEQLSRETMDGLVPPEVRNAAKHRLGYATCRAYHAEVLTVYFTDFVMQ
jgi:flagellar FliL protein